MQQTHQGILVHHLRSLFPGQEICENARKTSQIKSHANSSHYLELDVWFPKLNLCFEFQDEYHFVQVWYKHAPISHTHKADSYKRHLASQKGLRLIPIPCWWDGTLARLQSSIAFECPDLGLIEETPISLNPPLDFFQVSGITGVGELMLASFPMDSDIIRRHHWWLGEKYDGIRCCWNPTLRKLYSRAGNELLSVSSLVSTLPPIFVDGEIWAGRGHFTHTITFIKSFSNCTLWDLFRLVAFDSPSSCETFEERYARILDIPREHSFLILAPRLLCKRAANVYMLHDIVTENEGEGIILRKKGSLYEPGRSLSLLKMKRNPEEHEGIVLEIRSYSIVIELPTGATFEVPSENVQVSPSIGDIVTFSYDLSTHKTHSIPTNIQVFRIRADLTWKDVVKQYVHESSQKNAHMILKSAGDLRLLDPKPLDENNLALENVSNVWSKPDNRRSFFEKYAQENKFNPLIPTNWYAQSKAKILSTQGAKSVLNYHGHSISRAITDLFPEIGLKPKLWIRSLWKDPKVRRKFFEKYAKENAFDHLNAEHWYSQSKNKILATKGAETIVKFHRNDVATAVRDLFPEIGLKPSLWTYSSTWKDPRNRRKFFEKYAFDHGFDPLNLAHWYQHSRAQLLSCKGTSRIIKYHKHSVLQALRDLFPEFLTRHKESVP
eukprot:Phypoly_transcript_04707.p1 GENE.Phypoly_transcript_04707~~Phypoly_transcript_04707.p1  ORF type:complete len:664 (+),score=57.25 Phypoly_transcript_04707:58-2049(+)